MHCSTKCNVFIIFTIICLFGIKEYECTPPRPLLLVPGYTGSMLYARNTTSNSTFKIFPFEVQNLEYLYCKCGTEQSNDTVKRCDSVYEDIEIYAPTDRFGLFAIDVLNNETGKEYYHNLIQQLVSEGGYIEGETLFGFPYDWRQSFDEISELYKERVNDILKQTNSSKIDILSHSMGCVLTKKYLSETSSTNGNDSAHPIVERYISVGGPYGGIGASWVIITLWGTTSSDLVALPWQLHQVSMQFPSTYDFIAISTQYAASVPPSAVTPLFSFDQDGETLYYTADDSVIDIVRSANSENTINLPNSASPCPLPFRDDYYEKAKESWRNATTIIQKPNQYFEVYGISHLTPFSWRVPINIQTNNETEINYIPLLSNGRSLIGANYFPQSIGCVDGDGIITIESIKNSQFVPSYSSYLPVSHVELINDNSTFPIYKQFLGDGCGWQGFWNLHILSINVSNYIPASSSFVRCPAQVVNDGDILCDGQLCGTYDGLFTSALLKIYNVNWIAYSAQHELDFNSSTIESMQGRVWANEWKGRMILNNGEVIQFAFEINPTDCNSFTGWYTNDWNSETKMVNGSRVISYDNNNNNRIGCENGASRACSLAHAAGVELCENGFWVPCSSCVDGYEYNDGFPYNYPSCTAGAPIIIPSVTPSPLPPLYYSSPSSSPSSSSSSVDESTSNEQTPSSDDSIFGSFFSPISDSTSNNTLTDDTCGDVSWYILVICIIVAFVIGLICASLLFTIGILLTKFLGPRLFKKSTSDPPPPSVELNEINDSIF